MNVVAIGAHQDDIEFTCLGTLLRCKDRGDEVTFIVASGGELGQSPDTQKGVDAAGLRKQRNAETGAVADAMGARFVSLGQKDGSVHNTDATRLALVEALREAEAELILAPPQLDYHPDHVASSTLAADAALLAGIPGYSCAHPPLPAVPALYWVEPAASIGFQPSTFVDISDVMERKLELCRKHESQLKYMREWVGLDLIHYAQTVSAFRGIQCCVPFAEGFVACDDFPKAKTSRLLP